MGDTDTFGYAWSLIERMDLSTAGSFLMYLTSFSEITSARGKIAFGLFLSLKSQPEVGWRPQRKFRWSTKSCSTQELCTSSGMWRPLWNWWESGSGSECKGSRQKVCSATFECSKALSCLETFLRAWYEFVERCLRNSSEFASKDFCPHRPNVRDKFGTWKLLVCKRSPESGSELASYANSYLDVS